MYGEKFYGRHTAQHQLQEDKFWTKILGFIECSCD